MPVPPVLRGGELLGHPANALLPADEPVAARPIVERADQQISGRRDRTYRRSLAAADALAMLVALTATAAVSGRVPHVAVLVVLPLVVLVAKTIGLYDRDDLLLRKATLDEAPKLFHVATVIALGASLLSDSLVFGSFTQHAVLALWLVSFAALLLLRYATRAAIGRRLHAERVLVLGSEDAAAEIARRLEATPGANALIADRIAFLPGQLDVILPALQQAVGEAGIERVIIAPEQIAQNEMLDVIRAVKALGVNVSFVPRMVELVGSSLVPDEVGGMPLMAMRRLRMSRSSLALKRGLDVTVSGLGLLVAGPLLMIVALAIRLDSRGPVFFRQTRVGRGGERFEILKFRTMVDGADAQKDRLRRQNQTDGLFKIERDPRITRVGRILRKTSLDELPQLINVFRGDMALVGPRPLILEEDSQIVGWHRRRLALTPGMTGQWQILGSGKIPLHEMVKIDYLYVTTWSFWTDVKILLRTVPYVVRGGGL